MAIEPQKMDAASHTIKSYFKNNLAGISMLAGMCVIFFIGFYLRWEALDVVRVNDFFTRDVERAFNIAEGNYFPLAGPELNNGGRLPGPFMYLLLALPLLIHPSYESIFIFNFILNVATIPLLYFFLKRHFGIEFSVLATIFFSLSLHHIQAVMFPMNPSFIFPVVVLYIGAFLKYNETKESKYLIWILLTILLGVQLHFSIATYAVAPILLVVLLRKKISLRTIVAGLIVAGICFLPFLIHKSRDYVPNQAGVSIKQKLDTSFIGLVKIVSVQNTISRLAHSQPFEDRKSSKFMLDLFQFCFSIAFYSLFFIIVQKIRKQGVNNCTKELIIFSSFYFPALIYEIFNPWNLHFWYQYIFILPEALVIALFILSIQKNVSGFLKSVLILLVVVSISYFQTLAYQFTKKEIGYLDKELFIHVNASGSYKNSKVLLNGLMGKLNLTPQEFFDRVYFLNFYVSGYRRLTFAYDQNDSIPRQSKEKKPCYFIMSDGDFSKLNSITKQSRAGRYDIFIKDKSKKINRNYEISFHDLGFPRKMRVIEYTPHQVQSCYSNSFNPFVVTKSIRDLLIQAKGLSKKFDYARPFGVASKKIVENESFDSNNALESFYGEYVIHNGHTNLPFKLKVNLKRVEGRYSLRGEVESYYFFGSPSFNIRSLGLTISPIESSNDPDSTNNRKQVASRSNILSSYSILSKDTLATADYYNLMSNNGLWNYNRDWFREVDLVPDLKLEKDKYNIDVTWRISWRDGQFCCYTNLPQLNSLNLKKPNK
jgi:hypothetical protein